MDHVLTIRDSTEPSGSDYMKLSTEQRRTLQTVERVGASLSLIGVCLIFVTFATFKRLRTVPNTFLLFASIANVGASVACLIGYDGLLAGESSALCQAQGFLLEMFMQSDPWWGLAMAINVYMVFFLAANPVSFRKYLWVYCVICFGAPALPAIVLVSVRPSKKGPIYGNATLWCWIGDSWNSLRIFTYYIPIWVCIMLSAIIYIAVGYHVFHQRNQLRNLTLSNPAKELSSADVRESDERTTFEGQVGCYGLVTTEVRVTAEAALDNHSTPPGTPTPSIAPVLPTWPATHQHHHPWASPPPLTHHDDYLDDDFDFELDLHHYSIYPATLSPARLARTNTTRRTDTSITAATSRGGAPFTTVSTVSYVHHIRNKHHHHHHHPQRKHDQSECQPTQPPRPASNNIFTRIRGGTRHFMTKLRNLDPVKLAYLRTSFVFAISILITWAPSSINRVYTLINPTNFNYGLNMASAIVLPLQGVWNCVIYCATSWYVLVDEIRDLGDRIRCGSDGWYGRREQRRERERGFELTPTRSTMRVVRDGSFS